MSNKILIDEAVESLLAEYDMVNSAFAKDLRQALAEAALDALLDKMEENAKELGLDYMEGSAEQYEKVLEQPAPAQQEPTELDIWKARALQAEVVIEKFMTDPPPAREPLTDEQIMDIAMNKPFDSCIGFARAIEAAHGITSGKATEKGGAA